MAVEVITYNVGQGLFNLVCEKNDDESWFRCGVVDCGTLNPTRSMFKDTVLDSAVTKIKNEYNRCLSYIVLSHQDNDHWSRILDFLYKMYGLENKQIYKNAWGTNAFCLSKFGKDTVIERWENQENIKYTFYISQQFFELTLICEQIVNKIIINLKILQYININKHEYFYEESEVEINAHIENGCIIGESVLNISGKPDFYSTDLTGEIKSEAVIDIIVQELRKKLSRLAESAIKSYISKPLKSLDSKISDIEKIIEEAYVHNVPPNLSIYLGGADCGNTYKTLGEILKCFGTVKEKESCLLIIDFQNIIDEYIGFNAELGDIPSQTTSTIAISRNASSIVTLLLHENKKIMLPGDATLHTFSNLLHKKTDGLNMIIAPHHGSYNTNILLDESGNEAEYQPVKEFFAQTKPQNVHISAYHKCFGHPDSKVVDFMEEYAIDISGSHSLVEWDHDRNQKKERNTTKSIHNTEGKFSIRYGKQPSVNVKQQMVHYKQINVPEDLLFL